MISLSEGNRIFQLGTQSVHALRDVDLTVEAGEYISIMGPSGSGKSTLLNIIGLLDELTSGTYEFDGTDVTTLPPPEIAQLRRDRIGFVFQFFHLIPRLTARQNVELPLVIAGVPVAERRPRVEEGLEELGIAGRGSHRPNELSGGERQRVAIARATILRPRVLLADEPTGNLDSASGAEVVALLEGLNAQGTALMVVTHDADLGRRARRRLRMVDGEIVEDIRDSATDDAKATP